MMTYIREWLYVVCGLKRIENKGFRHGFSAAMRIAAERYDKERYDAQSRVRQEDV